MGNMTYYVKSLDSDHATKTLVGSKKVVAQTLATIVATRTLKPNTVSFKQKKRLSTTVLHDNYTKTYRPQGIIFTTTQKPAYILPFDLALVAASDDIQVHYHRMRNRLHIFYNHPLIPGYEHFIFNNFKTLIKKFSSPNAAWKAVNLFRVAHGQHGLPASKFRLCSYNEAVFLKPVRIVPVAMFGYTRSSRVLAQKLGLTCYRSAAEFYRKLNNSNKKNSRTP
jgi:hypothetical protein